MSTSGNLLSESFEHAPAPRGISLLQRFYWSLRRELWENRAIYLAPAGAAALFLIGFLVNLGRLPQKLRAAAALDSVKLHAAIVQPYDIAAALIMAVSLVVIAFYSVDALYGERRDRSILFWKSLPVSDAVTVLSKTTILLVIILVSFLVTVLTQLIMALLSSAALAAGGESVSTLWTQLAFFRTSMLLLYHLLAVHLLWWAPFYGWLLLVSAWARRAPFLWAFFPPVAICYLEKITFNTTYFLALLQHRFEAGMEAVTVAGTMPMDPATQLTPARFLATPGLWIGLALAAVLIATAIRLRRYRGPA